MRRRVVLVNKNLNAQFEENKRNIVIVIITYMYICNNKWINKIYFFLVFPPRFFWGFPRRFLVLFMRRFLFPPVTCSSSG